VTGKVTADGQALTAGTVTFRPDETKGNKNKAIPTGMIDSSGNYKLFTDGKEGAPLGWYKVGVSQQGMAGACNPAGTSAWPTRRRASRKAARA